MEEKSTLIKDMIELLESYAKTNIDLFKLKAISKTSDVISIIVLKLVFFTVVLIMIILLNIGLALWIGELTGKLYYGFLIVTAFYVFVAILIHFIPNMIKLPLKNSLIVKMLNKKEV